MHQARAGGRFVLTGCLHCDQKSFMVLEEGIPRSAIDVEAAQHEPPRFQAHFARAAAIPLLQSKQKIYISWTMQLQRVDFRNVAHLKREKIEI